MAVCEEYKKAKKEFDSLAGEREVIADQIRQEITDIYRTVIERNGYNLDPSKMNPEQKDPFKGQELSKALKKEIASAIITPEEIKALKDDKLFILTFYDAVARKGELKDTEAGRFVSEYLVQVLQNRIKEVVAENNKNLNSNFEK